MSTAAPTGAVTAPHVIPSLRDWTAGEGTFRLTDEVRVVAQGEAADRGELLAAELATVVGGAVPVTADGARPGDVELVVDTARRHELGREGYELAIGPTVRITAAVPAGILHGTRTLAQLLRRQRELPAGVTIDVPTYAERGVTVCASQINISPEWIVGLLEEMSDLKLNQLLLELKVRSSAHPRTATWSYYTPEEIREIVSRAERLGIEVIPEINSPGHMAVWLENLPDLQLRDRAGNRDEVRLDITTAAAFEFYTSLIDEYLAVFTTSRYWHMGADEYMIHTAFENFPQIESYAKATFGPQGTPQDAFVDFVNRVDEYVRTTHGKTLRIWNDGLTGAGTVELAPDIVVEHWTTTPVSPADLVGHGHRVMNASYDLYLVRGGPTMDTENLYRTGWHVGRFYEGASVDPASPALTGAKISLWPDSAAAQTEHEVADEAFMPLRFIAQATWTGGYALDTYAEFEQLARTVGRPHGGGSDRHQPLGSGRYVIGTEGGALTVDGTEVTVSAAGEETWALTPTDDGYYRIGSVDTGRVLDVVDGGLRLGVPVQIGAPVVAAERTSSNVQKWQLIPDGEVFEIVNAVTRQRLSLDGAGAAVQLPPDVTRSRWTIRMA